MKAAIFLTLGLLSVACRERTPSNVKEMSAADQEALTTLFSQHCIGCHGNYADGAGRVSLAKIAGNIINIKRKVADSLMPPSGMPSDKRQKMLGFLAEIETNPPGPLPLSKIKLPPGFKIEVWAEVPSPRSLTLGMRGEDDGWVFSGMGGFSSPGSSAFSMYFTDKGAKRPDPNPVTIFVNRENPNGIAVDKETGTLYLAERHQIVSRPDFLRQGNVANEVKITSDFPEQDNHFWKYLTVGPDRKLYVSVGAPCNVCDPDSSASTRGKFARIFRVDLDGRNKTEVAKGVRNSIGFDFHPVTGEMWFTDNGRDRLGDDTPRDELNRLTHVGEHFGFPYCHENGIVDPDFGNAAGCSSSQFTKPAIPLGPHVAALGMRFYTGEQFPEEYRNQIFIAEHGSWNRSHRSGYRVSLVRLDATGKKALSYEPFAEGWLDDDDTYWGRPVDVLVLPDGSLLVSDDYANVIYRIYYTGT
ncbi:MAG: PQQ-dependent sugar dehydrogenase [Oligoflexales bacterium]